MTAYTRSRANPDAWPENQAEDQEWFEKHSAWMRGAGHGSLSELAGHLWEAAAKKRVIEYKPFNDNCGRGLNLRGIGHGLPTALGIISEYGYHVLGLAFYLSAVIVSAKHGLPGDGFFTLREFPDSPSSAPWRRKEATAHRDAAWSYSSTHANPS
ncbi:MAG: hypothetical protein L3J99_01595 [Thermoplasmata archaeon]|nr:hypothetical protein [Thermoplasmata archaeon]